MEDGGSKIEDRGSRIEDRGSRIEDRGSRIEDRKTKIEGSFQMVLDWCALRRFLPWRCVLEILSFTLDPQSSFLGVFLEIPLELLAVRLLLTQDGDGQVLGDIILAIGLFNDVLVMSDCILFGLENSFDDADDVGGIVR